VASRQSPMRPTTCASRNAGRAAVRPWSHRFVKETRRPLCLRSRPMRILCRSKRGEFWRVADPRPTFVCAFAKIWFVFSRKRRHGDQASLPPALDLFAPGPRCACREADSARARRRRHAGAAAPRRAVSVAQPLRPRADARGGRVRALRVDRDPQLSRSSAAKPAAGAGRRARPGAGRHAYEAVRPAAFAPRRDDHVSQALPAQGKVEPGGDGGRQSISRSSTNSSPARPIWSASSSRSPRSATSRSSTSCR
jgi:hypothetical protein